MSGSNREVLRIGSRGSQLALWQAHHIADRLKVLGFETEIEIIKTTGDKMQTASLVQAGGKGLFTKEIEEALLARTVDVAVHSLKDLPTENPEGLAIAAIPVREDPRDVVVGARLQDLRAGVRVGTSSNRRSSQLRILRPDLVFEPVRGNVDTRLRKLRERQYDALVLAAAGLRRLGLQDNIAETLSPDQCCPAPGQGALGVQTRAHDRAHEICAALNDTPTAAAVRCERAVLAALGGGCQLPLGAYAQAEGDQIRLIAGVFHPARTEAIRATATGPVTDPSEIGERVARELIQRGARELLGSME